MSRRLWFVFLFFAAALLAVRLAPAAAAQKSWQVHEPIVHSNLALFPVSATAVFDARGYLTLDEGLRSGEVEVTELGAGLLRRRPGAPPPDRARVDTLALINHSERPLLLLAGEIVTGGKQDRVIAKDRIIPPGADPLPLDVFCVEPGRWHGASLAFGQTFMAAPSVREKAAVAKNQQEVWDATAEVRSGAARGISPGTAEAPAVEAELGRSSSYAQLERAPSVRQRLDEASGDLQRDYERALSGALRGKNVVGVVVAINGEVIWADLFADAELFRRYWPKLLRSYVVEAMSVPVVEHARASRADAERFLTEQEGRQIIEVEPGEYRLVQIDHPRYSIFELASLLEKSEPVLHFSKLRKEKPVGRRWKPGPRPVPYLDRPPQH
ncbi:MAG: hypothetical protein HYY26_07085 [Acidobacteria bacterium]|nr:hypothetical protein [Acidobacteriota bacterium]